MDRHRRAPLRLEGLEDRVVPTVDVFYNGTTLYLRGAPNTTGTTPFTIAHVLNTAYQFTVKDGAANLGTYDIVNNLNIQFTRRLAAVHIDLNQGTIPGNVYINQGKGYQGPFDQLVNPGPDDIAITDKSAAPSGVIGGSVQITGGSGQEVTNIGGFFDVNGILNQGAITIQGNLTDDAQQSFGGIGDQMQLTAGSRVGGNINTTNVDGVVVGQQNVTINNVVQSAFVGGNVNVNDFGVSAGLNTTIAATVGGNVSVNASAGTTGANLFILEPVATSITPTNSFIGGNLTVNLGSSAQNLFEIEGGAGATSSVVGGNVTWIDGNTSAAAPADILSLNSTAAATGTATIDGSFTTDLGNGNYAVQMAAGGTVNQNLTINGGNGTNDLGGGTLGGSFGGQVNGNLAINLGNGTNTFNPTGGVFGQLSFNGGNGSNAATYPIAAGFTPTAVFNFGSGTNSLVMQTANVSSLTVNGTGSGPNNTYDDSAIAPVSFPVTLNNFI